ncbi:efflux RND transporter periplasmic adaptor subunit [Gemmobacter straminiformis]|uniref:Efflux RND transporter periplasmic adaptor subunit n=2 Tax=Paragemmobacter straminiformis TaxID=2045119 RepID=A0A842I585_9RHOB|nr:efflux RND transporter periplasmic adaptor subunit [Gemmobacter straminiformis]MBC2834816.1 efflux RND transporter periplasmic adaptor subunit [Gemmobacter straminiformis]
MTHRLFLSVLLVPFMAVLGGVARAESLTVQPVEVTDWKAVYARIEARDRVPARARIGGVLVDLQVGEGDTVTEGQPLARIVDDKLAFQLSALESQKAAVAAQLANATSEVRRGEELLKQGVTTAQRLDALRTQADVLAGQLAAIEAQAQVTRQSQTEGVVLAPAAGRVLDVPLSRGAVVMAGEAVATLAVGGSFLRLAVPERLAGALHEGDAIRIEGMAGGKLVKIYPLIENGRVVADVEVPDLPDGFVDARVLVRLPVGHHAALVVPQAAIVTRDGLDFVAVEGAAGAEMRVVVPGTREVGQVEILTGLVAGDVVMTQAPKAGGGDE